MLEFILNYKMDSEEILEITAKEIVDILNAVLKLGDWLFAHKDEIIALIKSGWTNAKKIYNYLKSKYHK